MTRRSLLGATTVKEHQGIAMRPNDGTRSAAQVLIDQLVLHGVRHVFCVPGESYIAALDAMHDAPIAVTICRQEGGAAMMAEAVGKATGAPGICFVTRGPGATNAAAGLHVARQDSSPMILFSGRLPATCASVKRSRSSITGPCSAPSPNG